MGRRLRSERYFASNSSRERRSVRLTANDEGPEGLVYARYADFLDADVRRRGDALELGHDWRDGPDRYRVCWYEGTGEITAERLSAEVPIDLEDFHEGIDGPVEVLGRFPSRRDLEQALGAWPDIAPHRPHTLTWLRRVVRDRCRL